MQELRYYLEILLDHQCRSVGSGCPQCRSLQRICELIQAEIFSTVIYTETPLAQMGHTASPVANAFAGRNASHKPA